MPTSRTAAAAAWKVLPAPRIDEALRVVSFTDEDGATWDFDFSDLAAAPGLVDDLVAALVAGSSPRRAMAHAQHRRFGGRDGARYLAVYLSAHYPDVASIADISPEVWWAWRTAREKKSRWPGMVNPDPCAALRNLRSFRS